MLNNKKNWGGGGSGLDYVILLSEGGGWVLITVDYGRGEGGKKSQKNDYVICERPLITLTSEEFMPYLIILFSDWSSCYKNKMKF